MAVKPNTIGSNAKRPRDRRKKPVRDGDPAGALLADLDRNKALELKKKRKSYRTIASALGVSLSTAYRYVNDGWERVNEETDESRRVARAIEEDDLDAMVEVVRPLATDPSIYVEKVLPGGKGKGEVVTEHDAEIMLKAVDRMLKIGARRAEIRGTDAPKKVEDMTPRRRTIPLDVLGRMLATKKTQQEVELEMEQERKEGKGT